MNGDHMPISGHRRKSDPAHAKKIKEGGEIARKIAEETTASHLAEEVPLAEEQLLKDLEKIKTK